MMRIDRFCNPYRVFMGALAALIAIPMANIAFASEWPAPLSDKHLEVRQGLGDSGIALFPEMPYEATTLVQDEIIERARTLAGDHREVDALLACEQLMNDPSAHPALRRWAALWRISLLCFAWREWEAVAEAEHWLRNHPGDPNALGIKYTVARILAQRAHVRFAPAREDFWDAMNRVLSDHGEDTHPLVVEAILFARLQVSYGGAPYPERHYSEIALDALLRVEQAAIERDDTPLLERMERIREERIEPWLEPDFEQRRAEEALRDPDLVRELARLYLQAEQDGGVIAGEIEPHILEAMEEIRREGLLPPE